MQEHTPKRQSSWFTRQFLNSQMVVSLLILLLVLLIIWVFTRITHVFAPIGVVIDVAAFPIITSGVLYYLLYPLVDRLEARGMNRQWAIWAIFIGLILFSAWGIASLIPTLQTQILSFARSLPKYYDEIYHMLYQSPFLTENKEVTQRLQSFLDGFDFRSMAEQLSRFASSTFGSLGSVVGAVTSVIMGLLTVPIILYYLLADGQHLGDYILKFVPTKHRPMASRMMYQGHYQVAQYIRGQIIVAICVAIMFCIGYSIVGLDYAIALGVVSGFLNIIPFLGSFIAVIPAFIIALITSPVMVLKVAIVMMVEQTIEGRFIAPQVLGNNLKIHPVTILIVLLSAGKAFGLVGVILGVPGYAVIKVIVGEFYELYRERSGAYGPKEAIQASSDQTSQTPASNERK